MIIMHHCPSTEIGISMNNFHPESLKSTEFSMINEKKMIFVDTSLNLTPR